LRGRFSCAGDLQRQHGAAHGRAAGVGDLRQHPGTGPEQLRPGVDIRALDARQPWPVIFSALRSSRPAPCAPEAAPVISSGSTGRPVASQLASVISGSIQAPARSCSALASISAPWTPGSCAR
jgi:hypothetical protein